MNRSVLIIIIEEKGLRSAWAEAIDFAPIESQANEKAWDFWF